MSSHLFALRGNVTRGFDDALSAIVVLVDLLSEMLKHGEVR